MSEQEDEYAGGLLLSPDAGAEPGETAGVRAGAEASPGAGSQPSLPDENDLADLSDFFKVLGDSTRMKIMWALDSQGMYVNDIADLLGMTTSAISHQLKSLRDANLVKAHRDGKNILYTFADEHVRMIFEMGMEHIREEQGADQR